MADLLWASVEARPLPGISFPWILLKLHRPRNRVCISCKRKFAGRLLSNAVPPPSDSSQGAPSSSRTSDFDIISTSECSDGSIIFRFGDVTEMEKSNVKLEGVERFSGIADEVASGRSSSENSISTAALDTLHKDHQEAQLRGGSVKKVASESLSGEDTSSVVAIEVLHNDQAEESGYSGFNHTLPPEHVARSHSMAAHTVDHPSIVAAESLARRPSDHRVLAESHGFRNLPEDIQLGSASSDSFGHEASEANVQTETVSEGHELHKSSEDTRLGTGTSYSIDPEARIWTEKVSFNRITEESLGSVTELVEDNGIVGSGFNISSTHSHNSNAASLVEAATDIEEMPHAKTPEEDVSPAPSDTERAMSLKEEPREETLDEDDNTADLEQSPKASAPHDDIKFVKKDAISMTKTEEENTTSASSGSGFQVRNSSNYPSQEDQEGNIELEVSGRTALVTDEPTVNTSSEHITSEDVKKVESSPASALFGTEFPDGEEVNPNSTIMPLDVDAAPSPSALHNDGEFSAPEESVDGEERSKTTEVSVISKDEAESDKSNHKREEIVKLEFCLASGGVSMPHPDKALAGGEDAYFIAGKNWLGVADGAGQWSIKGTNAGLYAKELMENCKAVASDLLTDPLDVLVRSCAETQSVGSSTVLVARCKDQVLHVATIGDSKFIVIRNGVIIERSSLMFHEFNFPVQIERGDDPTKVAEVYRVPLDEEDVIIAATNGLFDNLYEQEIASIAVKSLEAGLGPQDIAEVLVARAQEVGRSTSARTPFADAAQAARYIGFTGGKLDDVTVIVSLVQKSSSRRT